jgi:hypothetical protein
MAPGYWTRSLRGMAADYDHAQTSVNPQNDPCYGLTPLWQWLRGRGIEPTPAAEPAKGKLSWETAGCYPLKPR